MGLDPPATDAATLGRGSDRFLAEARSGWPYAYSRAVAILLSGQRLRFSAGAHQARRADGVARWQLWHTLAFFDDQGQATGFQVIGMDITAYKQAEACLQAQNHALQLRHAGTQIATQANTDTALLGAICRLLVRVGGYRLAWAGLVESDDATAVRLIAKAGGEAGEGMPLPWAGEAPGQDPISRAIRTGQPVVAQGLLTAPPDAPGCTPARPHDSMALLALPLCRAGHPVGVLTLYAVDAERFSGEEIQLLAELSDAVASGLMALRARTEHQRMELALQDSEARFQLAMDATQDGVWDWNVQTGEVYYSPGYSRMLGYPSGELEADVATWTELIHPEDREHTLRANQDCIENRCASFEVEFRMRTQQGNWKWILGRGKSVTRDPEGRATRMIGTHVDITARKQAEEALRVSEAKYRKLFEEARDGIGLVDQETGMILDCNEALARMVQREKAELIGQSQHLLDPPPAVAGPGWRTFEPYCIPDQGTVLEAAIMAKTGEVRKVEIKVNRVHLEGKTVLQALFRDITARKRAESALQKSEARLAQALRAAAAGAWEWHVASRRTIWSDNNYRLLGLSPGSVEASYEIWRRCIHPDDRAEAERHAAQALEQGTDLNLEFRVVWPDGSIHWLNAIGKMQFDLTGKPVDMYGIQLDITARKQAEAAWRESEAKYRRLYDSMRDAFVQVDMTGHLQEFNSAYQAMLGYAADALHHLTYQDLTPARWHAVEAGIIAQQVLTRGYSELYEKEYRHHDGHLFPVELRTILLQDAAGQPTGMWAIVRDITERKRAEQALFEEKERAQITLHAIGDAVITTDADTITTYLNPVAETLTGWTTAAARGQRVQDIFRVVDEPTRQPAVDPVVQCLQEGKIIDVATPAVLISRTGREFYIDQSAAPIRGRDGHVLGAVLVFHDITETRRLTRQLEHDATHDALTGLINRAEFERRLERALASAQQYGARHALCYLDLDQFKIVNDTAGHPAGDALLKHIPPLVAGLFRDRDTLARLGGDEFGLLLNHCPLERAQRIAQAMVGRIREFRFQWKGCTYQIGVSIGVVPLTAETPDTAQLLTQADIACYTAKELGRNRVHLYQREDREAAQRHRELLGAAGLRDALEQGRFRLYYQPIVPLNTNPLQPSRYEVLLRMVDPSHLAQESELILPAAFIPAAERYGLMGSLDRWVIQTAFRDYAAGLGQTGAAIAINLSGNSLSDETLLGFIEAQFAAYAFPPERVCFEITETAAIQNLRPVRELMAVLKGHGSQFALDDFGSGLSSFRYLKTLPVDYLKIDGSFVKDMIENTDDHALVAAINQMSHTLGIHTVAEYTHNQAIFERLRDLGVDFAQGYFLGRPAPWGTA